MRKHPGVETVGVYDMAYLTRLLGDAAVEEVEGFILNHVTLSYEDRGDRLCEVTDDEGRVAAVARLQGTAWRHREDAKAIARWLAELLVCADCGQRLGPGEEALCCRCEARQAMELLRLRQDLLER